MARITHRGEPPPWRPAGTSASHLSRRLLILGAGAASVTAIGLVASRFVPDPPATPRPSAAATAAPVAWQPVPTATAASITQPPAAAGTLPEIEAATPSAPRSLTEIPPDMALVTSPRLPLHAIAAEQALPLIRGAIANWREVGAPFAIPVDIVAIAGAVPPGIRPEATFTDYDAMADEMAVRPGAVALVPLELVDFRTSVLSLGQDDPLRRDPAGGEPTVRIGVVGDIVPGRNVHAHMVRYGDFTRPFAKVATHLRDYDLTVANLEGNLSDQLGQSPDPHSTSFVSSTQMIAGFQLAGIDAVSLANNHSVYNNEGWGVQGLLDTIAALDAGGIGYFGAGATLARAREPWVAEVNGLRVAFLGIDGVTANNEVEAGIQTGVVEFDAAATESGPGTNPYASSQFIPDISTASESADIVIPYFHMGAEYVAVPTRWAANGARAAADAGASVVVTNHPHVIQGMEVFNGRPIIYSLGNFILDQMWSVEVRSGYILELIARRDRVLRVRCHPIEIEEFHQPRLMTTGESANLMNRFWASTDRIAGRV
ncbi:MAG: CapA family protein [Chloroflexia bacterium]|nr:CapA family protein [Chloroflexia bacterium]